MGYQKSDQSVRKRNIKVQNLTDQFMNTLFLVRKSHQNGKEKTIWRAKVTKVLQETLQLLTRNRQGVQTEESWARGRAFPGVVLPPSQNGTYHRIGHRPIAEPRPGAWAVPGRFLLVSPHQHWPPFWLWMPFIGFFSYHFDDFFRPKIGQIYSWIAL